MSLSFEEEWASGEERPPQEVSYFHRNLFATLCFLCFAYALATNSPYGYLGAMVCGALSRTAVRKKWPAPPYAAALEALWKRATARLRGQK